MEGKPKSREELSREVALLQSKIETLQLAQKRIAREAARLAESIQLR
jgi:hypothetical protein